LNHGQHTPGFAVLQDMVGIRLNFNVGRESLKERWTGRQQPYLPRYLLPRALFFPLVELFLVEGISLIGSLGKERGSPSNQAEKKQSFLQRPAHHQALPSYNAIMEKQK
jgi:hypothetical protein